MWVKFVLMLSVLRARAKLLGAGQSPNSLGECMAKVKTIDKSNMAYGIWEVRALVAKIPTFPNWKYLLSPYQGVWRECSKTAKVKSAIVSKAL